MARKSKTTPEVATETATKPKEMLAGWVSVAEYARSKGVEPRAMRRRLLKLKATQRRTLFHNQEQIEDTPVSHFFREASSRQYWVHPGRLQKELERDPDEGEQNIAWLQDRISSLEDSVRQLKLTYYALRRRVVKLDKKT